MNSMSFAAGAALRSNERGSALGSSSANCFTLKGGTISEGVEIHLNHPATGGKPALIFDGDPLRYVMRDAFGGRGVLYEKRGDYGIVRRAKVELLEGKNIPLLRKIDGETKSTLVHIYFGMPLGMQLRLGLEPLWAGTRGGELVARGESEALVEMKLGDILQVFYPFGGVGVIKYVDLKEGNIEDFYLDADASLLARLELLAYNYTSAAEHEDETRRTKGEDGALHGFASMIRMTFDNSHLRQKILGKVEGLVNGVGLRSGVKTHFRSALAAVGDTRYWGWMFVRRPEEPVTMFIKKPSEKSGPSRAETEAKRAVSRAKRHAAQPQKGSAGGSSDKHGKGKKRK